MGGTGVEIREGVCVCESASTQVFFAADYRYVPVSDEALNR